MGSGYVEWLSGVVIGSGYGEWLWGVVMASGYGEWLWGAVIGSGYREWISGVVMGSGYRRVFGGAVDNISYGFTNTEGTVVTDAQIEAAARLANAPARGAATGGPPVGTPRTSQT